MANNKSFKIKNGLQAGRYLGSNGTDPAGSVGYDLTGASYDNKSFSVASQDINPYGIAFNNDGTKLYMVGISSDNVYQYSLSTAFDISTSSYNSVSFSVASQDTVPSGVFFNNDGTKMYMFGSTNDNVYQYSLSTAFDLSTASYDSVSFSFASQDTNPKNTLFNNNGTKLYMVGATNDSIFQYSLSTAYNISTASYDSVSFSFASQDTSPVSAIFNNNGTKLYMLGGVTDSIFQYSLSTAYNVGTASYDNESFSFASQDTNPKNTLFNNNGTKLYMVGTINDTIHQYSTVLNTASLDLSTGNTFSFTPSGATTVSFTNPPASGTATGFALEVVNTGGYALTWPSSVKWHLGTAPTATATKELYTFVTTDGGTTYYGKLAGSDIA